jgi:hypothetical protein
VAVLCVASPVLLLRPGLLHALHTQCIHVCVCVQVFLVSWVQHHVYVSLFLALLI